MTIEQEKVIDVIGFNEKNQSINLSISDHLEWDKKSEKLILLQEKINSYLSFIESGELNEQYPNSENLNINIALICKFEPNAEGLKFLNMVAPIIKEAGFCFEWSVLNENT